MFNQKLLFLSGVFLLSSPLALATEWDNCPTTVQARQLIDWREVLKKKVLEGKAPEVLGAIKKCYSDTPPACYDDLIYYANTQANPSAYAGSSSGFFETADLTIKGTIDLPIELQAKDQSGAIIPNQVSFPDNILDVAKAKGWDALLYKTRSSGGFDSAPNLFILGISTPDKDIFLQTSPHPDASPSDDPTPNPRNGNFAKAQNTLTVITVDKTKTPAEGQMRIMRKAYGTDNYQWDNTINISSCTSCHTTPTRSISPRGYLTVNGSEKRMTPEQEEMVDRLNNKLGQPNSWGKKVIDGVEVRFGPSMASFPLGWAPANSETRKEEFMKACATERKSSDQYGFGGYQASFKMNTPPEINYPRLAEAMNCVRCHDGSSRGPMHEGYGRDNVEFKILVDRSMPHGMELNGDERMALVNCLYREREKVKSIWRETGPWMTKASCYGMQFKNGAPKPQPTTNPSATQSGQRQ